MERCDKCGEPIPVAEARKLYARIAELNAALGNIIEAWEGGVGFHGDPMVSALDHAKVLLQKSDKT